MVFVALHLLFYAIVSGAWHDIEMNLYGMSQPSIVDAVIALYFELFLLIASVIVLVVAAMVLTEQDKQSNAKKGGGQL